MATKIPLEHPGIIIKEEFIEPLDLTSYAVSKRTGISQTALGEIIKGKRGLSAINALKLSKFFGVSESFFLNLQTRYNLDLAKEKAEKPLAKIIPFTSRKSNETKSLEE
ncbi:MAG: HigA family addiction module antitoxin [Desulforhopalus sp.]|nr:HigA family addiction module antitoxin [Desulforhopalus sp.]